MAKKKKRTEGAEMPAIEEESRVGHIRLTLSDRDFERLKSAARSMGLSISAFSRQALLKDIRRELKEAGEE